MEQEKLILKYQKLIADKIRHRSKPSDIIFEINNKPAIEASLRFELSDEPFWFKIIHKKENKIISDFRIYQLPHCCAYAVSCSAYTYHEYRNKGIGTILNLFRQEFCYLMGYTSLLCTDIEENVSQRSILAKNNWKDIHSLTNRRTRNKVFLSVVELKKIEL